MSIIALLDGGHHDFNSETFDLAPHTIAKSLAHINRFTGHVGAYSVAQHCVLVARLLPPELQLSGLLHDAHEAVMGDMSSPLKKLVPEFAKLENFYLRLVDKRFNVQTSHKLVAEADLRMCVTEAEAFGLPLTYFPDMRPGCAKIKRWSPEEARDMWLNTFYALRGRA